MDGVRARQELGNQGVPGLVVGRGLLLLVAQDHGAALLAHHDLVLGLFEVEHGDLVLAQLSGMQGSLVDQVLQVRAGKTGRAAGQDIEVDFGGQGGLARVHLEDALAALEVGVGDHNLTVEAARTQQGRVEDVGTVGGGDEDDALVGLEAVHLDEHGIEGLLALVMAAAETSAALPAHGVDLVDEDETGCVLLALDEQVAHAGCAHADEHLDEV
ncbi:hypothetical protein DSECCO2_563310 [anaerobic digester metagenome]